MIPMDYDWKSRWRRDLTTIAIQVAKGFKAIDDDSIEDLEAALAEIESLVESHA